MFVGFHLVGRTLAQHPALGHDDDRIAEPRDEIHVVLDHAECVAALLVEPHDGVAQRVEQRTVDAGADLVEEHDLGVDHHGAAEFEQFLLAARQIAGQFVGDVAHFQKRDDLVGTGAHFLLAAPDPGWSQPHVEQGLAGLSGGHHHQVFPHSQCRELMCDLEGAQQTLREQVVRRQAGDILAIQPDPAGGRPVMSRDHVEQRGLSGSVGTDQAGDGPFGNLDAGAVDGTDAAEVHVQILDPNHAIPQGGEQPGASLLRAATRLLYAA